MHVILWTAWDSGLSINCQGQVQTLKSRWSKTSSKSSYSRDTRDNEIIYDIWIIELHITCMTVYVYLLPTTGYLYIAMFWYFPEQWDGICESQVSKLCRYCQNPLCCYWLCQRHWPGVVCRRLISYYAYYVTVHYPHSFYYRGLSYT